MDRVERVKALVDKSENYDRANGCAAFFELLYGVGRFCENCSLWREKEGECGLYLELVKDGKIPPSGVIKEVCE